MNASHTASDTAIGAPMRDALIAETLRVRGTVQGVGFRPHVWRIAHELGIAGSVINDEQGVLIEALGPRAARSSPSRAWAATSSPAMRPGPTPSRGCARSSAARPSRSP